MKSAPVFSITAFPLMSLEAAFLSDTRTSILTVNNTTVVNVPLLFLKMDAAYSLMMVSFPTILKHLGRKAFLQIYFIFFIFFDG